ncbi:uracil-DNA glycosylase family protein [Candidatus Saccharibacteria bacterium]|nr:uracil-DNA glycosylase family protein [Candidatus Saccharibacteria bacterium]
MEQEFLQKIMEHESNAVFTERGWKPLFTGSEGSKIVIVGQAPGIKAQMSGIPWNDKSGQRLIEWLGITETQFRDPAIISHLPMDFYYPGKGRSGDLPPRSDFAARWHPKILDQMPDVKLVLLIGNYAQKYYLGKRVRRTLTETVFNYEQYLPEFFPLVHPSPLNFRWQTKNPWFEQKVVPKLKLEIARISNYYSS